MLSESEFKLDYVFFKTKKSSVIWSLPLCEILNGQIIKEQTTDQIVAIAPTTEENKVLFFKKHEIDQMIMKNLEKSQKDNCFGETITLSKSSQDTSATFFGELDELILQPAGSFMSPELFHFMEKYEH